MSVRASDCLFTSVTTSRYNIFFTDYRTAKQKLDQTVLTITKALTKTTNCTFRAKKVEGHGQKKFSGTLFYISPQNPLATSQK